MKKPVLDSFILCLYTSYVLETHFSKQGLPAGIVLKAMAALCKASRKYNVRSTAVLLIYRD